MFSHRTAVAGLLLLLVAFYAPATAMVTTIALTDGDASGISGGKFGVLSAGSVNEIGEIVFSAQLQQGFGGVDPNNDTGIWLFDGSAITLLAREGAGNVPGTAGGSFSAFHAWGIDDAGSVGPDLSLHPEPYGRINRYVVGDKALRFPPERQEVVSWEVGVGCPVVVDDGDRLHRARVGIHPPGLLLEPQCD